MSPQGGVKMSQQGIYDTLHSLFSDGDVIEIRLKSKGKLYSGYYDYGHFLKLSEDVAKYDELQGTEAIYFTANPVQDVLLARCNNRIQRATITTADHNTKYRRYLLLDIDPERPAGTTSTVAQHNQSIELAYTVAKGMTEDYGWPDPVIGDSGNGAHLMYRIDEPNTPEAKELVDNAISAIISVSDTTPGIKKEKWSNAARIWRLYGTMNRKGDELPDKGLYHRRSMLLQVPEDIQVVTTEQLEAMAAHYQPESETHSKTKSKKSKNKFDIEGWMDKHDIKVVRTKKEPGRTIYVLETCPLISDHTGNKEAVIMQWESGKLGFKCHHGSCDGKGWKDVREKYEPGYMDKRKTYEAGPDFMDGKTFVPKIVGDDIISKHDIITFPDSMDLLLFKDGVFNLKNGEQLLRVIIKDKLGEHFQRNRLAEVISYIQISTYTDRDEINRNTYLVNVKNGMYDVINDKLLDHDPKYKSTIQLNVTWKRGATCEAITKFLSEVATPEAQAQVIQYAGYSCTPDIKYQRSLLIDGPQQNGKSTFLEMVCHMMGQDNVSQQSLQALNEDRFSREQLNNKLVNFYGDLPAKKLYDNSIFKMLTSDKYIDGEKKHGQKFRYKNNIHQMYALNKVPVLDNPDELAFFRRIICVTFPKSFEGKADRDLIGKITTEPEISGFFNLAMLGLRILLKQNEFCYNKSVEDIQTGYLNKSDPITSFIEDCVEYNNGTISKDSLYHHFTVWCGTHNIYPVIKKETLGKRLINEFGFQSGRESTGDRKGLWLHVGFVTKGKDFDESDDSVRVPPENMTATLTDENQQQDPEFIPHPSGCQGIKDTMFYVEQIINKGYDYSDCIEKSVKTTLTPRRIVSETPTAPTKTAVRVEDSTLTDSDGTLTDTTEHKTIRIKILKKIPVFTAVDGNDYELNKDDIVSLPWIHAELFLKRKFACQVTDNLDVVI